MGANPPRPVSFCRSCKLPYEERDAAVRRLVLHTAEGGIRTQAAFDADKGRALLFDTGQLIRASGVTEPQFTCCVSDAFDNCDFENELAAAEAAT